MVYSRKNVREQRFRVGYWVVTYIFSLSFTLSEKNLLIVRNIAIMASTVLRRSFKWFKQRFGGTYFV